MGDVELILRAAFHIHVARIPVAVLRLVLRSETRPDAELRVAKPIWHLILLERIPRRLEFSRRDRLGVVLTMMVGMAVSGMGSTARRLSVKPSAIIEVRKKRVTRTPLTLTPGFSRVMKAFQPASRFNGLPARPKPLKRF